MPIDKLTKILDLPKFREFRKILGIETVKKKKSTKRKLQAFEGYKDFEEDGIDL